MRAKNPVWMTLVITLVLIISVATVKVVVRGNPETTISVNPPTSTVAAIGENFTINIAIQNVPPEGLWAWQAGLKWDPNILDANSAAYNFSWFGPSAEVLVFPTDPSIHINNTEGELRACAATQTVAPVTGSGYVMEVEFHVKDYGESVLNLTDVVLCNLTDSEVIEFPVNLEDGYFAFYVVSHSLVADGISFTVVTVGTSNTSDLAFNKTAMEISFNVIGPTGTLGICNVTIPRELLRDNATHPWTIFLDGTDITSDATIVENGTHSFIYFTYTHSTHLVVIRGAEVIPEFPAAMIVPLLIIATLVAAILGKMVRPTKRRETALAE